MTDKYFTSKTAMATAANVTRNTLARWMQKSEFPKQTTNGWERVKVLEFAKVALAKAAKSQTGTDADLKREKLSLQVKILETELQRKRGELAVESRGTVPRDAFIEELRQISLATWQGMNAVVTTIGNRDLGGNTKAYAGLCSLATELHWSMAKVIRRRLSESPLKLTPPEIEDATQYSDLQW